MSLNYSPISPKLDKIAKVMIFLATAGNIIEVVLKTVRNRSVGGGWGGGLRYKIII